MPRYRMLQDEHVQPLADAVCTVLARVGVLCQNRDMLEALAGLGAEVVVEAERARFPEALVRGFVESLRLQARPEADASFAGSGRPGLGGQVAPIVYDWGNGERRQGNRADFITMIKLASVLDPDRPAGHCLLLTDEPPAVEPLQAALLLAEYAYTPGCVFAWNVRQADPLNEMGHVLGREHWYSYGATCFAHPLRFDKDVADRFARRVREGEPATLTAMPVAGMTTPVTPEGFIAVAAAEFVATWLAGRALNPACGLGGSMWAGVVDMASGSVSYSAPDAMFYAVACTEFLARWTGLSIPVGGGEYCDAREPGLAAALEKAYKAMTIAAFTGRHPGLGQGMLECGRTLCPVQLMIERDLADGTRQFNRPLRARPESVGLADILDIDLGLNSTHMTTALTLERFRELWLPQTLERAGWRGPDGDRDTLHRAQGRITDLLATYRKPTGREAQLRAMRKIADKATHELAAHPSS